ncbi:MAG: zinc ABC transporter solute-binding protein [Thermoplasmatales archaeon]|jgi:zinc transport system substrate-binding protein|nr:zinc ABC transporter solute-binding protein [Thermoplasmatales archaeon]
MERRVTVIITLIAAISMVSGGVIIAVTNSSETDGRPVIYTSMNWQKEMIQEITGEEYVVYSFIGANQDPHDYEGTPVDAARVGSALAYFYIGAGMDWERRYLNATADSGVRTFDCFNGARIKPYLGGCTHEGHDHGGGADSPDLHIWTSPWNLTAIAEYVTDVMKALDPENASVFDEGYERYVYGDSGTEHLEALAESTLKALADEKELMLVVWHGSWGYLLRDCGIDQHSIEGLTDSFGTVLGLGDLNHGEPYTIFVGTEAERRSAAVAAPGYETKIINPLAGDWLIALGDTILKISEGLIEGEH